MKMERTANVSLLFVHYCTLICCVLLLQKGSCQDIRTTCNSLDDLAANFDSNIMVCKREPNCAAVFCNITGPFAAVLKDSEITFLPCASPPSIKLIVRKVNNEEQVNQTVNQTSTVYLLDFGGMTFFLEVTLNHTDGLLGIETDIREISNTVNRTQPLINATTIVLDRSSCPTVATVPGTSTQPMSTAPMSTAPISTQPMSTAPMSTAPMSTAGTTAGGLLFTGSLAWIFVLALLTHLLCQVPAS